ncbi:F0F1 ATP synthase subunit B [Paenibacillus sp. NPDC058174]|uniref:F0F1 ATP synthase subunit B n=1 Tax=Paenibacillus sp. NPDC058174 TaxID=3346366 RepID=UPI0036DDF54B
MADLFNVTSLVLSIIVFGILYWSLNKYCFKPLFSIMEQRKLYIQNMQQQAESNRAELIAFQKEQQQILINARNEAKKMLEETIQASNSHAEKIIQIAKNETSLLKDEALRQIQKEKAQAMEQLTEQVDGISEMIVVKITGNGTDPSQGTNHVH